MIYPGARTRIWRGHQGVPTQGPLSPPCWMAAARLRLEWLEPRFQSGEEPNVRDGIVSLYRPCPADRSWVEAMERGAARCSRPKVAFLLPDRLSCNSQLRNPNRIGRKPRLASRWRKPARNGIAAWGVDDLEPGILLDRSCQRVSRDPCKRPRPTSRSRRRNFRLHRIRGRHHSRLRMRLLNARFQSTLSPRTSKLEASSQELFSCSLAPAFSCSLSPSVPQSLSPSVP